MKQKRIHSLKWLVLLGLLVTAVISIPALAGGGLNISWWTVDGGGGSSSGGNFALEGTIGQADTGSSSGGNFQLNSGFWAAPGAVAVSGNAVYIPVTLK